MHAITSLFLLALAPFSDAQPTRPKKSQNAFQNPYQIGLQLYKDWQCQHASTLIDLRDSMTHAALSAPSSEEPYAFCHDLSGAPYTGISPGAFRVTGLSAETRALEGSVGFYAERDCGGARLGRWKHVEGLGYVRGEGTGEIAFGVAGEEVVDPCHPYDRLHMGRVRAVLVTVREVEGKWEDLRERVIDEEPFCAVPYGEEGTCAGQADFDDPFPVMDGARMR